MLEELGFPGQSMYKSKSYELDNHLKPLDLGEWFVVQKKKTVMIFNTKEQEDAREVQFKFGFQKKEHQSLGLSSAA